MARRPVDDPYEVLGVDPRAGDEDVRRAYRALALRWHPDRAGPDTAFVFQKVAAAYAVLSDPAARAVYDRAHGRPPAAAPAPPAEPRRRRAPGILLRRLSSPLNILLASGVARRAADGAIELLLDADEVATGGMVAIPMRVQVRGEAGPVEELFSAWLAVPPDVADGTMLAPSALLPGMVEPVAFRVRRR